MVCLPPEGNACVRKVALGRGHDIDIVPCGGVEVCLVDGFAGYNNFSNGAAEASAVNKPKEQFVETSETKDTETASA